MDSIANLLTALRNAEMASHKSLLVPSTKISIGILSVLKENGFIKDFSIIEATPQNKIEVTLSKSSTDVHHFKRISKLGRRTYTNAKRIPIVLRGLGMVIISTSEGVMSGQQAKKQNLGGEILCEVY